MTTSSVVVEIRAAEGGRDAELLCPILGAAILRWAERECL